MFFLNKYKFVYLFVIIIVSNNNLGKGEIKEYMCVCIRGLVIKENLWYF